MKCSSKFSIEFYTRSSFSEPTPSPNNFIRAKFEIKRQFNNPDSIYSTDDEPDCLFNNSSITALIRGLAL